MTSQKRKSRIYQLQLVVSVLVLAVLNYLMVSEENRELPDIWFWGIWLVSLTLGLVFSPLRKNTLVNVISVSSVPVAVDLLLIFYPELLEVLIYAIAVLIACYCVFVSIICFSDLREGKYHNKELRFIKHLIYNCRVISGVLFAFVLVFAYITTVFMMRSTEAQTNTATVRELLGDERISVLLQFKEETWKSLPEEEKLTALQCIADAEAEYLGLPEVPTVRFESIEERGVGAYYIDSKLEITLHRDLLPVDSALEILEDLFHEEYHCYEYRLADFYESISDPQLKELLILEDSETYHKELNDYISQHSDVGKYYDQLVEQHSREYAAKRVIVYRHAIEACMNES